MGKTGKYTPNGAAAPYASGGPYGEGRFGYTQQSSSLTAIGQAAASATGGNGVGKFASSSIDVAADLFHDSITSASFASTNIFQKGLFD